MTAPDADGRQADEDAWLFLIRPPTTTPPGSIDPANHVGCAAFKPSHWRVDTFATRHVLRPHRGQIEAQQQHNRSGTKRVLSVATPTQAPDPATRISCNSAMNDGSLLQIFYPTFERL